MNFRLSYLLFSFGFFHWIFKLSFLVEVTVKYRERYSSSLDEIVLFIFLNKRHDCIPSQRLRSVYLEEMEHRKAEIVGGAVDG